MLTVITGKIPLLPCHPLRPPTPPISKKSWSLLGGVLTATPSHLYSSLGPVCGFPYWLRICGGVALSRSSPLQVSREMGGCGCRRLECGKRLGLIRRLLVRQRDHALPGNPDSGLAYFKAHTVYYISWFLKKRRPQLPAIFVKNTDT